jgi:nitrate/nitrite-specific signal transduction histidine kinase
VISKTSGDVVFARPISRAYKELAELLQNFQVTLQDPQFQPYAEIQKETNLIDHVGCWAHSRRKFQEALDDSPARHMLRLIARAGTKRAPSSRSRPADEPA